MSGNNIQETDLDKPRQNVSTTTKDKTGNKINKFIEVKKEVTGKTKKGDKVTLTVDQDKEKKISKRVKEEDKATGKKIGSNNGQNIASNCSNGKCCCDTIVGSRFASSAARKPSRKNENATLKSRGISC